MSATLARSRPFDALGRPFAVISDDHRIVDHVSALYAGLADAASVPDAHVYSITRAATGDDGYDLDVGDEHLSTHVDPSVLVTTLVHDVNRRAIDATGLLAAHAGGVVGTEGAVVLPAHMEAGKTTLTAGLVRAGYGYLSDEAVAFDFDTLDIAAYAKPLSLDPGSWHLFPELEPQSPFDRDDAHGTAPEQWQVAPDAIRPGAAVASARARYVVFPHYEAGVATTLVPVSRGEGVVELAKNTFHFRRHGRRGLDALARLVPELDCYRLAVGDLDAAVATVTELVGAP